MQFKFLSLEADSDETAGLKILVADNDHLTRSGLKLWLQEMDPASDILEAETLDGMFGSYGVDPEMDLILLEPTMSSDDLGLLDCLAEAYPKARIVAVSMRFDMTWVQAALRRGVMGFIPKCSGKASVMNALRFVLSGGVYIPPEALTAQPASARAHPLTGTSRFGGATPERRLAPGKAKLTPRQIDVLVQLLEGKANKQICRELNLALGTVKCHVAVILDVLEVSSRSEAIAVADKHGWREWLAAPSQASAAQAR